jgi:7-cyano-7-deazaguanine synthase
LSLEAVEHLLMQVNLGDIGGSALTTEGIAVPKNRESSQSDDIPVTYVPARNTVLLSLALAWSEVIEAGEIWIGVSSVDYSGYPDCRPEFIDAFQSLARVATKASVAAGREVTIRAPLLELTKAETIEVGLKNGVDYGLTHSCYDPYQDGAACGRCDACVLRRRAFAEIGVEDPIRYK